MSSLQGYIASPAAALRRGLEGPALAGSLLAARARTLGLARAWCEALPELRVPCEPTLNLPLWEWGHVAWFQDWWMARNRQRERGVWAEPDHARGPALRRQADALYNSSTVPHALRWSLDLPGLEETLADLQAVMDRTLQTLEQDAARGCDLYFGHLVLVHEHMHAEASVYMAQALGLPMPAAWALGHEAPATRPEPRRLLVPAQTLDLGQGEDGFAFDNERPANPVRLDAFEIDAQPVAWGEYLAFLEDTGHPAPGHLRRAGSVWEHRVFDRWEPLPVQEPAVHLNAFDAQAWCDWAGRGLPSEAQWECAARTQPDFRWGRVWEWTSSAFEPYPGFATHPYVDYSKPWFGTHRVLRGASLYTAAEMVCPSYRNFFLPQRRDIPAGFRTVTPAR